jgi:hypothetical protein
MIMNKYRDYRMLKKVKELLNTPIKEELYVLSNNIYMTNNSLKTEGKFSDPNRRLRVTQVEVVARLLLQQISRLEESGPGGIRQLDRITAQELEATFRDLEILFEELDHGILLSEAEKATRRMKGAKSQNFAGSAEPHASTDLAALKAQISGWQQEKTRWKKRLNQVESSIRELGLNVNDVRCTQILQDKNASVAALDLAIDSGVSLLGEILNKAQAVYATLESIL